MGCHRPSSTDCFDPIHLFVGLGPVTYRGGLTNFVSSGTPQATSTRRSSLSLANTGGRRPFSSVLALLFFNGRRGETRWLLPIWLRTPRHSLRSVVSAWSGSTSSTSIRPRRARPGRVVPVASTTSTPLAEYEQEGTRPPMPHARPLLGVFYPRRIAAGVPAGGLLGTGASLPNAKYRLNHRYPRPRARLRSPRWPQASRNRDELRSCKDRLRRTYTFPPKAFDGRGLLADRRRQLNHHLSRNAFTPLHPLASITNGGFCRSLRNCWT